MNFHDFWESICCLCISFGTATLYNSVKVLLCHKTSVHIYTYRAIGWQKQPKKKKEEGNSPSWAMLARQMRTVHWMSARESDKGLLKSQHFEQSLMLLEVDSISRKMLLSCSTQSCGFSCSFEYLCQQWCFTIKTECSRQQQHTQQ